MLPNAKSTGVLLCGLVVLGAGACFSRPGSWFRADRTPSAAELYDERFELITLAADAGCESVLARQGGATHPIIVLVPGIGGDGEEMRQSLPEVMRAEPAAVFMARYGPFEARDAIAERLAAGISRLAACIPDSAGRLIVLAHSAGGVVSSRAAAKVQAPPGATGDWLTVITVASPLAGTSRLPGFGDPTTRPLMRELGMSITEYPPAAPGVRVLHLRTSAQSDEYMRQSGDHLPNDPKIGVPGALQIDLPPELDHPSSLVYVAKKLADGTWTAWFAP